MVAAYSATWRLSRSSSRRSSSFITTKKERLIRMPYKPASVSKLTRILFPIVITVITGIVAPSSVSLVGFLMFGNLIRECGVLDSPFRNGAEGARQPHDDFPRALPSRPRCRRISSCRPETLLILGARTCSRSSSTPSGGVMLREDTQPLPEGEDQPDDRRGGHIRVPDVRSYRPQHGTARRIPQNFLLMHSIGVNVSGQIASVIAGGLVLNFFLK